MRAAASITIRAAAAVIAAVAVLPAVIYAARPVVTTRPGRTLVGGVVPQTALYDTIPTPDVRLSGYDKPVRTDRETIHVTNNTGRNILELTFDITYYDMQGRMLHNTTVTVSCDIAAGDTQMLTWPTWDRQYSFCYEQSRRPRAPRTATLYTITATPVSALAAREDTE